MKYLQIEIKTLRIEKEALILISFKFLSILV